ncbi:MAG: alpha-E domain-containing protein [Chitinophagaceae bacterium]|nr:alpha-E domain-containing protein [Chitinophagaceae bacterium]
MTPNMLSRIADSLFWLNRYMERSDGLIRGIKTHYILLLDKGVNQHLSWKPMLEIFTTCKDGEIELLKNNTEAALHKLLLDTSNYNSLKVMVTRARENARGVQDHITKEVWEHVNQMFHSVNALPADMQFKGFEAIATIEALEQNCILYNGVADTTMPRGIGWNFMNLGRYIERSLLTIEMSNKYFKSIEFKLEEEKDILQWRPLLLSLSGYELHLKSYRSTSHNHNALHQVLFNENFTRSVLYTLKRMNKYFTQAIKKNSSSETEALSKRLGRLLCKIEFTDFDTLNEATLQPFLKEITKELNEFSGLLAKQFFSYS